MNEDLKYPKRLIEVDLPIKRISAHARREKSIRHGHISTMHIWWARRPLAACRAVLCASLWPDPADELCPKEFKVKAKAFISDFAKKHLDLVSTESYKRFNNIKKNEQILDNAVELRNALLDFIADFSNWDNSVNNNFIQTSRKLTDLSHITLGGEPGTKPLVVDPFAGGGSIPLEALRIGSDVFASDLNPVASLLNKVLLEYIPKYGVGLADEVKKCGERIKKQSEKELSCFFPDEEDGSSLIAYLWARTIICEGPNCGAKVPLIRSLWLVKKQNHSIALRLITSKKTKKIDFEIINNAKPKDVLEGTVKRGSAICPICNYVTSPEKIRIQLLKLNGGADHSRLYAKILSDFKTHDVKFKVADSNDYDIYLESVKKLKSFLSKSENKNLIPDEPLPYLRSIFNVNIIGIDKWEKLFNRRQILSLLIFLTKTKEEILKLEKEHDPLYAKAIGTCLAFALDRCVDYWSSLAIWANEFIAHTFGRQALGIIWDYAEANGLSNSSGNYLGAIQWIAQVIKRESVISNINSVVDCCSATEHPLSNESTDFFFTDPPYYDAVPYADLSDFFYVWLKRSIGNLYPSYFKSNLSPKKGEIVQLSERNAIYAYKTREYFEDLMQKSLVEAKRLLKPNGICTIVFAHKSTIGWETQLSAMINSGWTITASWSIDTERPGRLRANKSAALASSIHLVCKPRKSDKNNIGDWNDILTELPKRIHLWMPRLAKEGIVGADAIFACLGPALEIFSKFEIVEKPNGDKVFLGEYLEKVWAAVSKEALSLVFKDAETSGFEEDARITAMWLWTLIAGKENGKESENSNEDEDDGEEENGKKGKKKNKGYVLEYDTARKIAQGLGASLEDMQSVIEVKGDKARLLPVEERMSYLFGKEDPHKQVKKKKSAQKSLFDDSAAEDEYRTSHIVSFTESGKTVLDRLHQSMLYFSAGRTDALKKFLVEEGAGNDDKFWKLAQALSALYPKESDEKRWVDGVQTYKKSLGF